MTAFCRLRGDLRTFRADRILDARLLDEERIAPIRFAPLESAQHPKCAYCTAEFEPDQPTVWCPTCEVQYHDDCARVQRTCAIYGCSAPLSEPEGIDAEATPEPLIHHAQGVPPTRATDSIAPWSLAGGMVFLAFVLIGAIGGAMRGEGASILLVAGSVVGLSRLAMLWRGRRA